MVSRRGLHQKVIAFSLYGNFSDPNIFARYVDPMRISIERLKKEFPEWISKIYTFIEEESLENYQLLIEFFKPYDNVELCNAFAAMESLNLKVNQRDPSVWRFLPLLDPAVDYFMSRDTDGVFLEREVQAVNQWLDSSATFHIIRDHPWHCVPILAGLWGAKVFQNRRVIREAAIKLLNYPVALHGQTKGIDQELLSKFIWPLTRSTSLVKKITSKIFVF